jgi:DNA-binding response OmpR family regulator
MFDTLLTLTQSNARFQIMSEIGSAPAVMVLDDNPAFCAMVLEILQDEGFIVTACTDASAALQQVVALQPHLVISDWWLRDGDGQRVAFVIRRDPRTAHLPVLVCTADGTIHDEVETLSLDGIDVIHKPFDLTDFVAAVRRQLHGDGDTFADVRG